jgi:hypothetical protein
VARHANIRPISDVEIHQNIKNENRKLGFTLTGSFKYDYYVSDTGRLRRGNNRIM